MAKEKLQTYDVNIYRLNDDRSLEEYLEYFNTLNKFVVYNGILKNDKVECLYYSYINKSSNNEISWFKEWKKFFDIDEPLRRESTTGHGLIIFKIDNNLYVMVFGRAYNLIKDFIIPQFGMNIASILFDGKSIDSISSKYFSLNKNKSITSYYGDSTFDFAENEAVDLLKADIVSNNNDERPLIDELLKICKKRATIGMDNVKLTIQNKIIKLEDLNYTCELLNDIKNYNERFSFPKMTPVKNNLLEESLDKLLLEKLINNQELLNISIPFYSKNPSDEYEFLNNISDIQIKIGKIESKIMPNVNRNKIQEFLIENKDNIESLRKVNVIIDESNSPLTNWIDCQIEYKDNFYALSNGKWYQFNNAYIENINKHVKSIEKGYCIIKRDSKYDFSEKTKDEFYTDNKKYVHELYGSEKSVYKEFIFNCYATKNFGFGLFDRMTFNGNIEVCDLYGEKSLIHCKIGNSSNLEECIRQSIYGTRYYFQNNKDVKTKENKQGLKIEDVKFAKVIYLSTNKNIDNFKISDCQSLRVKQTFIDWVNMCHQIRIDPILAIAKYES